MEASGIYPFDRETTFNTKVTRNALPLPSEHLHSDSNVIFSFFSFLKLPDLAELSSEDAKFLEMKGCLHVPAKPILNEFVQQYFLHVHPCLPILNEADFWSMYHNVADPTRKVHSLSLFTLRAMLFASCAFVPAKVIRLAGLGDTRTARNTLYSQAKLLFDFKAERDALAKAQGALLLTYQSSSIELHCGSLWLTISIQNAMAIGAHVYNLHDEADAHGYCKNTKKRLWWSILLRDRILPLGMRRHLQITPQNFDLSLDCMTEEDFEDEIYHSCVYNPETKRLLARVLRIQCKLAIVLTGVIMLVYSPNGFGQPKFMSEEAFLKTVNELEDVRANLSQWSNDSKATLGPILHSDKVHESVALYSGLTFMYYHAARLALCHFEALTLEIHQKYIQDSHKRLLERIRDELEDAASCITNSVKGFLTRGIARHLPISAIAYTALPLLLNALDVKLSASTSQTATRQRRFRYYAEIMQSYRDRYDGTDGVAAFIQKALQFADNVNISIMFQQTQSGKRKSESCGWPEVFTREPRLYLRLWLTLDYAFTRGSFPQDADLPEYVRELDISRLAKYFPEPALFLESPLPAPSPLKRGSVFEIEDAPETQEQQLQQHQQGEQPTVPTEDARSPSPSPVSSTTRQNPVHSEFHDTAEPYYSYPRQTSTSASWPVSYDEFSPTFPPQDLDGGYLDFSNFEDTTSESPAVASFDGAEQGLNYPVDRLTTLGSNMKFGFNEEVPMWTDNMLNEVLGAITTQSAM
ncbi:hypothetical protein AJ79_00725 [Helicocarpus griseus UAMH5409]|uniref:Xylanolytic transcriptional activator regulatory domain-containing protein n=1 Tax=Helicocarpus griseus UAMH5409 TaxID=1447875 RepID=A0A2B7YBX8_9EURO|nr:hypothetical protein AJ79_00725 [Helicocarpus griseus UAMH5409]